MFLIRLPYLAIPLAGLSIVHSPRPRHTEGKKSPRSKQAEGGRQRFRRSNQVEDQDRRSMKSRRKRGSRGDFTDTGKMIRVGASGTSETEASPGALWIREREASENEGN